MKITDVKTYYLCTGFTNWLFVKVETDEGLYGWGEGTLEGQVTAAVECIQVLFERSFKGEDPRNIEKIWQKNYRHGFWKGGFIHMTAISAIDQALWDINGKIYGVPVYKLLGGAVRDKVRAYSHAFNVEMAKDLIAAGFDGVKTGEGKIMGIYDPLNNLEIFGERLRDIRAAIGPEKVICIDNHGRSYPDVAIKLMKVALPYNIHFFEEPIPPENMRSFKSLREAVPDMTLAAGERLFGRFDYREVCQDRLLDVVQPDVCHCGGITEIRKIQTLVETYQIRFAPHNPNGPVSTMASIHVAAVAQNFDILECAFQAITGFKDVFKWNAKPENGYFALPTEPGLGIDIDEEAIKKYGYQFKQYAPNWAPDGQVAEI
jgi:galactonate dehydratase